MKYLATYSLSICILMGLSLICMSGKEKECRLQGFTINEFGEQVLHINNLLPDTKVVVNAPSLEKFDIGKETALIIFALPNGNTIEWTAGKQIEEGDDWHYNIQHIGAQTRFLRKHVPSYNWVVAYMQAECKSWPAWSKATGAEATRLVFNAVDSLRMLFINYHPVVMLNGHSGGGRFIFNYIDGNDTIPDFVKRISFIDSNYGYEDSLHYKKLISWLTNSNDTFLDVIAYKDSLVVYNDKPLVSPTGGTWYRSRKMQRDFSSYLHFTTTSDTCFIRHSALRGRVQFWLKNNPTNTEIYHTVLVERNGFIHSLVLGTRYEEKGYKFWGERAYAKYIYPTSGY